MEKREERNVSLDLLKVIGMFLIVCIHFVGYNKLIDITAEGSSNYIAMLIINAVCMVAVPCYFLISGYFLCKSRFRCKKILKIWGVTLFYSLLFLVLFTILGISLFTKKWINSIFPVLSGSYWFVSAYILLYFLFPFLNLIIHKITQKQYQVLLGILLVANCICATIFPINTIFDATSGLSIVYAIFLYLVAAYIRMYKTDSIKASKRKWIYFVLFVLFTMIQVINFYQLDPIRGQSSLTAIFANRAFSYNSIFCFIASVSLFLFFIKINIKNKIAKETILYFRPLLFAVYLIHSNPIVTDFLWNIINGRQYTTWNVWSLVGVTLGISFFLFILCIGIEVIRKGIFYLIGRLRVFQKIDGFLTVQYNKLDAILDIDSIKKS